MGAAYSWGLAAAGALLLLSSPAIVHRGASRIAGPYRRLKQSFVLVALEALGGLSVAIAAGGLVISSTVSSWLMGIGEAFAAVFALSTLVIITADLLGKYERGK